MDSPKAKNNPGFLLKKAIRSCLSILKNLQSLLTAWRDVVFSESLMRADISPIKYPFLISKFISASGQSTNLNSPSYTIMLNLA